MTLERDQAGEWPVVYRPQDPDFEGTEFSFEACVYVGPLPRWIWVTDIHKRSCVYFAARTTIVKVITDHGPLKYTTLEHDRDLMPQVIVARDGWGNSCRYEALDPRGTEERRRWMCPGG
jgi:hypothetical protein